MKEAELGMETIFKERLEKE